MTEKRYAIDILKELAEETDDERLIASVARHIFLIEDDEDAYDFEQMIHEEIAWVLSIRREEGETEPAKQ